MGFCAGKEKPSRFDFFFFLIHLFNIKSLISEEIFCSVDELIVTERHC